MVAQTPAEGERIESLSAVPSQRLIAIDYIKAAAILAVMVTHTLLVPWDPRVTSLDRLLRSIVVFHVPSFLLVSGFLYAGAAPVDAGTYRRRLTRILIPYLVASFVAEAIGFRAPRNLSSMIFRVATCGSLGIYYYVFVLTGCVLFTWPLSRLGPRSAALLLVALCTYGVATSIAPNIAIRESFFWAMRNPVHLAGYFLAGWLVRLRWESYSSLFAANAALARMTCVAGLVTYGTAIAAGPNPAAAGILRALYTVSVVGLMASFAARLPENPAVILLSRTSYTLYLYHNMFQLLSGPTAKAWHPSLRIAALLAVGLVGSTSLAFAASRALGEKRARLLLGV